VNPLRTPAGQQAKAILAGLIALLSALVPVLDDGVTSAELLGVAMAGLVAYGAVFELPNGARADPTTSTPQPGPHGSGDLGAVALVEILAIVALVLAIIWLAGAVL
jgi:hypothetical protein